MRAIGFRRGMVEASFLLESSFIELTSIVIGTLLGLLLAWNIIADTRQQPSWGEPHPCRPLAQPGRHLPARLRRRHGRDDRTRAPSRTRATGRSTPL
jgi:hypothetical protein